MVENRRGGRTRRRLRGMMETKTGKAVGITSVAAPIIGYIVNDLKKPDSITRRLVGKAVEKIMDRKTKKPELVDISDKVEIVEPDETDQSNHKQ